jgi:nicotinate-nucleotide pyrophosphorylase (carboxylating)
MLVSNGDFYKEYMNETKLLNRIVSEALSEDLGTEGDITSKAVLSKDDQGKGIIKSKESGVLSGIYLVEHIYKKIDNTLSIDIQLKEGALLENGTKLCTVTGSIYSILSGERVVLNFLQRLSGIATGTAHIVSLIKGTRAKLLDTRKTTPTLRILEKKAVLAGGGGNHRFGLFDMILIKDTHVKAAGGPAGAIRRAKAFCKSNRSIKIEVEVQSLKEFFEAIDAAPDRIMLDNMSLKDMAECVSQIKKRELAIELEASGNVTAENIRAIAETGVDFISAGSITHSAKALDIHFVLV